MTQPVLIDGSAGEGGGQIVRSSLTLSLLTQKPVVLKNIRKKRGRPGLMRQHLTCVQAAQQISGAEVEGAHIGSQELRFAPGPLQPGDYTFSVGSAGSTSLVLQTILPALAVAEAPSRVDLRGGTHNPLAPPFDFLQRAFFPLIERMGRGSRPRWCALVFIPLAAVRRSTRSPRARR
jgi:RNA 3'-terminal phosphate cyclase (ATP)